MLDILVKMYLELEVFGHKLLCFSSQGSVHKNVSVLGSV